MVMMMYAMCVLVFIVLFNQQFSFNILHDTKKLTLTAVDEFSFK